MTVIDPGSASGKPNAVEHHIRDDGKRNHFPRILGIQGKILLKYLIHRQHEVPVENGRQGPRTMQPRYKVRHNQGRFFVIDSLIGETVVATCATDQAARVKVELQEKTWQTATSHMSRAQIWDWLIAP
ncbi:MAG: hypothetical protein O3A84_09540 [Proteobacteria bacterium]|nr:hypothetical protein [Pseudomonadota bacterium]